MTDAMKPNQAIKIDFYILPGDDDAQRYRTACRLVEKAYMIGHRIHIHSDTVELAKQLDELLWTFRDRSFIPHELVSEHAAQTAVTIGYGWVPQQCDVLVNLATDVPEFFSRFARIAEIIDQEKNRRESGRKRYRYYREQGYVPNHHRLHS